MEKLFILRLFRKYSTADKYSYYLIKANTREEAVEKYNENNATSFSIKNFNSDDLYEVDFNNSDIFKVTNY